MAAGSSGKMMQYDYLVKLLLIGDSGVGKSSLLAKFTDDKFTPNMSQTIGMDFKVKMLELGGRRVKLQIWDTAGQERFNTITQQYYRNAMGVILVYDSTSEDSFANVRRWAAQVAAHGKEGTDRLLVGNKADCDVVIDSERGRALAEEYGMPFVETSAKSGMNVKEAFVSIADTVRLRLQKKEGHTDCSTIRLGSKAAAESSEERKACCTGG
mmetsp:Transcript_17655/g.37498  ORF Transcript_17655/g.37498 Transcript_17655/m.37498 type:complete len:212 (-) Transcript_17655:102-737(-)